MFGLDNFDIAEQTKMFERVYDEAGSSPLLFDQYLGKVFNKLDLSKEYPKEVKIPKSLHQLLKGDLEPERIIKLDKPLMYKGQFPMWFGDSSKGVNLRGFGYKNGDSRYPSEQRLDDTDIHGILGGATGQGKSVTLNSLVCGVATEYAPWEVRLVLADAKIAGFKPYAAEGKRLPHITSIAATTDADYIISVLEDLKNEMLLVNSMFSANGYGNLISFRKGTGLALPRTIIFIDEFQTMFKNAAKKAKIIESLIDDFARLGRSTGYHLFMASQEPGTIPQDTLGNITVRAALGCMPAVSTKLLGNDAAAQNLGAKGRLIVNTKPATGLLSDNMDYRVPYLSDDELPVMQANISQMGDEVGFRQPFSFYDETSMLEEEEYRKYINEIVKAPDRFYLGEPSYVMREPDGIPMVRINFTGLDIENMMIWCDTGKNVSRYGTMLKENIKAMNGAVTVNVLSADDNMVRAIGLEEVSGKDRIFEATDSEMGVIPDLMASIYVRKIVLASEVSVFTNGLRSTAGTDELFYEYFTKGSAEDTEVNRHRIAAMLSLISTSAYTEPLAGKEPSDVAQMYIGMTVNNGCQNQMMTYHHLTPVFNWIVGLDKVIGWGRDSKPAKITKLKKALQDCSKVNIRFILTTTTIEDLKDLKSGIRYYILDGVTETQVRGVGSEDYPETISSVLGVLFDKYAEGDKYPRKFKKMAFTGEIFS